MTYSWHETTILRISLASYHESICSFILGMYILWSYMYCRFIYIYIGVCLWSTNQSLLMVYPWYPLGYGNFTSWYSSHLGGFGGLNNNRFGWVAMQLGAPPEFSREFVSKSCCQDLRPSAFIFVGETGLNWVFKLFVSYSFEHWWYCSWTKLR